MVSVVLESSSSVLRTPSFITNTASAVTSSSGGWFFYSNNPEWVNTSRTADNPNNKYLCREYVSGSGQLYTWHDNQTGTTDGSLKTHILIYNPNSFQIRVSYTNHGLTNSTAYNDIQAWKNFWSSSAATTVTINPYAYGTLFAQSVENNRRYGVIARMNITTIAGSPATAVLYDIAYKLNASGATSAADAETNNRKRGLGNNFFKTITPIEFQPTSANGQAIRFATRTEGLKISDIAEADLVNIIDSSGGASGLLEGNYGLQHVFNVKIRNTFSTQRTFCIFLGSIGGTSRGCINYNGQSYSSPAVISAMQYADAFELAISPSSVETVSFQLVVPAGSATPFVIGARTKT